MPATFGFSLPSGGGAWGGRLPARQQQQRRIRRDAAAGAGSPTQQQASWPGATARRRRSCRHRPLLACSTCLLDLLAPEPSNRRLIDPLFMPQGVAGNPWLRAGLISGSLSMAGDVLAQLLPQRGQVSSAWQQASGLGPDWLAGWAWTHAA